MRARIGRERAGEVAVDLDGIELPGALQQSPGQSAAARSDLDDALAAGRRDAIDDAANDGGIVQEVLAEALTNRSRWLASSIASASAARKTPAVRLSRSSERKAPFRDRRWCAGSAIPG